MAGRQFSTDNYRFGFNGKENDESWGDQLIQDYGFRLYNPAIGKFLSVDPLAPNYPYYTSYQFAGNTPVGATDLDGLEPDYLNRVFGMSQDQMMQGMSEGQGGPDPVQARPPGFMNRAAGAVLENVIYPAATTIGAVAEIPENAVEYALRETMESAGWEFGQSQQFLGPIQSESDAFGAMRNDWFALVDAVPEAVGTATSVVIDAALLKKGHTDFVNGYLLDRHLIKSVNKWTKYNRVNRLLPKSGKFNTATIVYDNANYATYFGRSQGIK